ncbi:MAG TPA: hypothetical protein VGM12_15200 [Trebonia sp.]
MPPNAGTGEAPASSCSGENSVDGAPGRQSSPGPVGDEAQVTVESMISSLPRTVPDSGSRVQSAR